jgi:ribonuclease Z
LPPLGGVVAAQPLMKYTLSPASKAGLELSECLPSSSASATEAPSTAALASLVAQYEVDRARLLASSDPIDELGGQVSFLGTASAIPSKLRTVSGIILSLPPAQDDRSASKYCILDCGEGTLGQMMRLFGSGLDTVLRNLACVYVSHLHADHHLGFLRILRARLQLPGAASLEPLVLVAPSPMLSWLRGYSECEALSFRFVNATCLLPGSKHFADASCILARCGISTIRVQRVIHCPRSFGLVLHHSTGWSLAYSGDTRPCPAFSQAAQNVTVLIHEATFDDELAADAAAKNHSTIQEAVQVGLDMRARHTVLTHFSQRYPRLPNLGAAGDRVGFACDLMVLDLANISALPALAPVQAALFADV